MSDEETLMGQYERVQNRWAESDAENAWVVLDNLTDAFNRWADARVAVEHAERTRDYAEQELWRMIHSASEHEGEK